MSTTQPQLFTFGADKRHIELDDDHHIWIQRLPNALTEVNFDALWELHPPEFHTLVIHGREVKTPRWQQAYGKNYRYTGSRNNALPVPDHLAPYLTWCRDQIDPNLNALLLNWYDGLQKHYIGAHRDDTRDLIPDSNIVTISLGQTRTFRMRPWKQRGFTDVDVNHGDALVIPWSTNLAWTHEVPHFARHTERRISITIRAFA